MKRNFGPWTLIWSGVLLFALGCDPQKPVKTALTATPEAVILIQDTQELCVKTGKAGVRKFEEQTANVGVEDFLRRYFAGEAAPDFAAADRATAMIDDLLPKVREEASAETATAIEDLAEARKEVCRAARTPRPSELNYEDKLRYATESYVDARDKLAALYTVPDADAQFARHKFEPLLDQARDAAPAAAPETAVRVASAEEYDRERQEWEKAQQYQARQQAEHEAAVSRWREREESGKGDRREPLVGMASSSAPAPVQTQQTVQGWYAAYNAKAAPTRAALASYLEVRQGDPEDYQPACQELLNATSSLLADPAVLSSPDRMATQALKRAYAELRDCAQFCITNHNAEATYHLAGYQSALREATAALRPYSVAP